MNSDHNRHSGTATKRTSPLRISSASSATERGGAFPLDNFLSFVSSLTLTGAGSPSCWTGKQGANTPAPVSLTTEHYMDFDEDSLMEFHRDMADMYGLTWEEYFELGMEAHVC